MESLNSSFLEFSSIDCTVYIHIIEFRVWLSIKSLSIDSRLIKFQETDEKAYRRQNIKSNLYVALNFYQSKVEADN